MKSRVCSSLFVVFSCLILLVSCADVEQENVKFRVLGSSGDFIGTYSIDSGDVVSFGGESIGDEVFKFEKTVEVEDQLEISTSPLDPSGDPLSSLEIKVYRDNKLIKTVQDTSDPVEEISLIYTSGEAAETDP